MLCEADAGLVRRDPLIAGLPTLLDPDAFAETLRRAYPEAGITAAEPCYVRYKAGTSCLVGYSVSAAGARLDLYARAHSATVTQKFEKAAQRESVPTPLGDGIRVLPDDAIVVYPFPNDHELPALRAMPRAELRSEMLRQVLPDRGDLRDAEPVPLRYKPERRFVAHLPDAAGGGAVLKFYTKEDYVLRKDNVDTFVSLPPLRVPRRLGRSRRYHLAAIEWLEGAPLARELAGAEAPAGAAATVGAALAHLHGQKPKKLQTFWTAERYAQTLVDAAAALGEIAPDLEARARRLAERIGEKLVSRHWRARRGIHGDLSADQVLLANGAVGIVDFDRAGYGDPRLDLGAFQAKLDFDVICETLAARTADSFLGAMLESYREASGKDITRKLDRFTAAALLQLAVEPFRHRHPGWRERTESILARAESLGGGAAGAR